MVGWHHWLDGHEFEQAPGVGDAEGSLACCSAGGCKELDMTERLNWYYVPNIVQGTMLILTHFIYKTNSARERLSFYPFYRKETEKLRGQGNCSNSQCTEVMESWSGFRQPGFQAVGWITAACWAPTQWQPWSQASHLDLSLMTIFKIVLSRYKWRCKGSEVKKLAKVCIYKFIIGSSKHSYLTLGWPCNLLSKVSKGLLLTITLAL